MDVLINTLVREHFRQLIHRRQRMLLSVIFLGNAFVDGDVCLPENEGVCVDVLEGWPLFLLDCSPERTDIIALCNLDGKGADVGIAENQTVEVQL